jgi:hypothetical protein
MSLSIVGNNVFIGIYGGGIYLSTENGNNWTETDSGLTSKSVLALATSGNNIFAGTEGGIFLSTNNGNNWNVKNDGLTNYSVSPLVISGNNIFAGTWGDGIFRAKLSDFGISNVNDETNYNSILLYPNPAGNNLNIIFHNNKTENKIEIINLLGTKVMEYYSQEQRTTINIESLPRGVYFLRTGNQTKMFVKE